MPLIARIFSYSTENPPHSPAGQANRKKSGLIPTVSLYIKVSLCYYSVYQRGAAIAGGKKEGLLIKKGKIIEKIPQEQIVARLKEEIDKF